MALQLQPPSLSGEFEYISIHDEAVDQEAEDFADKWKAYREGQGEPPLKNGITPTVWTLRQINDARLTANLRGVNEAHGSQAFAVAIAAVSLQRVSGLNDSKGKPYKLKFVMEDGYRVVCEDQLNEIGANALVELGQVVITHKSPS